MLALEDLLVWLGLAEWLGVTAVVVKSQLAGRRRQRFQAEGQMVGALRSPWIAGALLLAYAAVLVLLWQPILPDLAPGIQLALAVVGFVGLSAGAGIVLWGRLALGRSHNISSVTGVELFADHHLITAGPYALVRHPMYSGFFVAILGTLLLYRTWTIAFIVLHGLVFVVRARREEAALARTFGEEWQAYASRVPAFVPRLGRRKPVSVSRAGGQT